MINYFKEFMKWKGYKKNFYALVTQYVSKLSDNPIFFKAKVRHLKVNFFSDTVNRSNGIFTSIGRDISINYSLNKKDPEEFILYILAHELAHCLFWNGNLKFDDYCTSDESYAITFVQRDSTKYGEYGLTLEENLADYMAICTVCSLRPGLSHEKLVEVISRVNPNSRIANGGFEISKKILSAFIFDGYTLDVNAPFDKVATTSDGMSFPMNLLLYEVCNGNLSSLITEYDLVMGKGSWHYFNVVLSKFFLSPSVDRKEELLTQLNNFCSLKSNN